MVRDERHAGERPSSRGAPAKYSQYPSNNLREPVRALSEVPSLHEVVLAHFENKQ